MGLTIVGKSGPSLFGMLGRECRNAFGPFASLCQHSTASLKQANPKQTIPIQSNFELLETHELRVEFRSP